MDSGRITIFIFVAGLIGLSLVGQATTEPDKSDSPTTITKRSSSAIALTENGVTLLAVNPDSNSVTLIDATDPSDAAEIPVGSDPRTVSIDSAGRRAYVANRMSGDISVIDLASRKMIAGVSVGYRPFGVLVSPDGKLIFVTEQGGDRLHILDSASLTIISSIPTADRPSGLALADDGQTLYVTHLLTNTITLLDVSFPYTNHLPVILGASAPPGSPALEEERFVGSSRRPLSTIMLWPDSNLIQSIVISPDGRTAYVPHTRSNSSNQALTFDTTLFPLVSLIDLTTGQHLVGQQLDLGTLDPPGVGLPLDAAITPDGGELWVLNSASNDITVIDLATGQRIAHVEVGDNPRGIVISPDGSTVYVNNTLEGTVSFIDTSAYSVTSTVPTTEIPLPPLLLQGKRLFHTSDDARMGNAQWIACNSCHFEAEHDGRTWSFGFSGPRNTVSLFGMVQTYPLRWSGEWDESADSEFAIRKENFGSGLIPGEMHCRLFPPDCVNMPPNQGLDSDLDALAAYLDSLPASLSPNHAHGEPLTPAELRGQAIFHDPELGCADCHPAPLYTDKQKHDVGTATPDERIGPAYDTPTLRGLFDSSPYFHDGSAATLHAAITRPSAGSEHDVRDQLTQDETRDLVAFLLALPFDE